MSETENNTTPETDKKPVKKTAKARHKHAKKPHPLLFAIALIIVILLGTGYMSWQFFEKQRSKTDNQLTVVNQQLDKMQRAQRYQSDDQQTQIDALDEKQQELKRSFASLLKNRAHLRNDWLLSEAEYLVKLANHRLILEKDINTAITALEAADARLKEVADPALLEVRKVLLEHTQSLRTIEQPDITGMALQISALKKEIPALPMQTPDPATVQQRKATPSSGSQVKGWDQLPRAMWEDLKSLVIIRDHSQAVQPLIPPEQHYFLVQNLNLQLEQARLALLKANNSLYIDSLSTAKQWIENYFDTRQQSTQSILSSINALAAKNITPAIPDISRSFKVLQQYRLKGFVAKKEIQKKAEPKQETKQETKQPLPEKPAESSINNTKVEP